jgi:HD-like signal output (HDOD) protein
MKSIMFVDDEQDVLDGLRNALRGERSRWSLSFALGAEAALRELAERHFDVLVTDMRMPGQDGLALLRIVRQRHPEVARIVLSGHADLATVVNASAIAHRYLPKPCESGVLRDVITGTLQLQEVLASDGLRQLVGGLGTLPTAPRVYQELTAALADPEVDFKTLAAIVERDAAMAARALQFVNSAYCGLSQRVTSVQAAVRHLGLNTLRHLALTVEVFREFRGAGAGAVERLERHAQLTARIARALATEPRQAEAAFAAGLLHDVGKLVLASRAPDAWARAVEAGRAGTPLVAAEKALLGADHAEIGAYLLGLWDLPHDILQPVAFHHTAAPGTVDPVGLVAAADALSHEVAGGAGDVPLRPLDERAPAADLAVWRAIAREQADSMEGGARS